METAHAVSCRGLRKTFGRTVAVDGVDLDVVDGEILALLGPSGCGKTTFLRLIAGFERPDAGLVSLDGRVVAGNGSFLPPERRRVGVVFQDYALFPHLNVAGNVGYGVRGRHRAQVVEDVLELVGLSGLGTRMPSELSGGQQQRVALARALAPKPRLVLLDEPFASLDAALRQKVRSEVRAILQAATATAVFVTHDQEEALSLADRVAIMSSGRLHQVGPPEIVYTRPADPFVASFVGGANVMPAQGNGHELQCSLGALRPAGDIPSGAAVVVVRPESVRLRPDPHGTAVVRGSTFYGHDQVVEVTMPDGQMLRSRCGPGRFFEPGDKVQVTFVPDEAVAFPV